jgi:hypothetical protein
MARPEPIRAKGEIMSQITRTIAGQRITLEAGQRYFAGRPMADPRLPWWDKSARTQGIYPVFVERLQLSPSEMETYQPDVVGEFTYDQANEFINAFNNGTISFEGRVW